MNASQTFASAIPHLDGEINLLRLLDVLLDARWLISGIAALALVMGGTYALFSSPVYEANSLIQVEDSKPGAAGALGEAASLFDIKSPATAEIEILRSRLVVGKSVDELQLYVSAKPKYLPLIGDWLARRATGLSDPGFLGMGGYVYGTESIRLAQLEVPPQLQGAPLPLLATQSGFELRDPAGQLLVQGKVGITANFRIGDATGRILVSELQAKPGAAFSVQRDSRLGVIEQLQNNLTIAERGKQSGVIAVALQGNDAEKITRTLSAVGSNYVRQNTERKSAEAEKSLEFLGSFLPQLKKQLEDSEARYNKFRNLNGTFDLGTEGKNYLDSAVKLQASLLELQQNRRQQSERFTTEHPVIQTLDAQITAVNNEIAALTSKVKALPNIEQDLLRLTRDVKVNGELYLNLLNNAQQLRLVKEGKIGNVRVVDTPVVPELPINPKRSKIIAISLMLGLLLGIGIAFLRNSLHPGIKNPSDIEHCSGLHVFATVPLSAIQLKQSKAIKHNLPGTHVLALTAPSDPVVESLRSMRTALEFAMLDARNNLLLFTGPTSGIGKSFTSVNFAAVLGAANKRVLLVDADLRKGHLNHYFGQSRQNGLSEVISGRLQLEQALRRAVLPQVDFLSTGILPPNPAELLMTPATRALLGQVSSQYDFVIIDAPPILAASDAGILATLAGAVFLLARAEVTALGEITESVKRLGQSGATVKGVVFNGLDTSRKRYSGYGYLYNRYRSNDYQ